MSNTCAGSETTGPQGLTGPTGGPGGLTGPTGSGRTGGHLHTAPLGTTGSTDTGGASTGDSQTVQVTHHNVLNPPQTSFLGTSTDGVGQAGNTDIASTVNALSADLAKSDLVNVGGAAGAGSDGTTPAGLTVPETLGAGTLLNPDQKSDQSPLLPPHHH
jgi:hypothetical protein